MQRTGEHPELNNLGFAYCWCLSPGSTSQTVSIKINCMDIELGRHYTIASIKNVGRNLYEFLVLIWTHCILESCEQHICFFDTGINVKHFSVSFFPPLFSRPFSPLLCYCCCCLSVLGVFLLVCFCFVFSQCSCLLKAVSQVEQRWNRREEM